jgi:DNA polymerase-3 subunit chi
VTEVRFYHLTTSTLEDALPKLLQVSLERGWRCAVEAGSQERVAALDAHLWTFAEDSFLPHGPARDPDAAEQPIVLSPDGANPNGATVRFFVDGAAPGDLAGLSLAVLMFDGRDEEAVTQARARWTALKAAGHDLTYWKQDAAGRWAKQA